MKVFLKALKQEEGQDSVIAEVKEDKSGKILHLSLAQLVNECKVRPQVRFRRTPRPVMAIPPARHAASELRPGHHPTGGKKS